MTTAAGPIRGTHLFLLAVGIVGVSMSGPVMAGATMVPALAMSLWRTALGAAVIAPPALVRRRAELTAMPARLWRLSALSGLMLAGHFATWVTSLHYTSVASATALVCLQVAWVVVIARLTGEAVAPQVFLGVGIALAGVVIVSGVDLTISARAVTGDLLAVAGGLFAAGYMTVGSRVREHTSTVTYTFVCYGACAAFLLVACAVGGVELLDFGAKGWLLIVTVTVVAQLLGHSVFNHLLAVMSPTVVSMVLLLEVPGAALLAGVFLDQVPPIGTYLGLALVCAGLAVVVRARALAEAPVE